MRSWSRIFIGALNADGLIVKLIATGGAYCQMAFCSKAIDDFFGAK